MNCQRCGFNNLMDVNGKVSDMCWMELQSTSKQYEGYVPRDMGIGGGDYLHFTYCLDCGQIQNKFPVEIPVEFWEDEE